MCLLMLSLGLHARPVLSPPKFSFCKVQFSCINSFCHKKNPPGEHEKLATHLKPFATHFPSTDYCRCIYLCFADFLWWPNRVPFYPVGGRALVSSERHRLAVARETCLADCSQKTTCITSRFPNLTFLGGGSGLLSSFCPFCFSFLTVSVH